MPTPKHDIENKIADLMIDDSDFDAISTFVIGYLYEVPDAYYPLVEINIFGEEDIQETLQLKVRRYYGSIRFDIRAVSMSVAGDNARKRIASSYTTIQDYVDDAIDLFSRKSVYTLENLSGSNWAVRQFQIVGDVEYGIDARSDLLDSYENFGILPFICEIQQEKTT